MFAVHHENQSESLRGGRVKPNNCIIPIPPSANHLWKIFGNRQYRTKAYKDWLEEAATIMGQTLEPIGGKCCVDIAIFGGKGLIRSRDLDNCIKPVIDALRPPTFDTNNLVSKHGAAIIQDDSVQFVNRVSISYMEPETKKSEAYCVVSVEAFE